MRVILNKLGTNSLSPALLKRKTFLYTRHKNSVGASKVEYKFHTKKSRPSDRHCPAFEGPGRR